MIEIIVSTLADARQAQAGGADRLELVSALSEGGLTPSYGLIKTVMQQVDVPVHVMIRPHSKHFVYGIDELSLMREDIKTTKKLGAQGVVLGTLTADNQLDTTALESLLDVCQGLDVTFHRAIDETDHVEALNQLVNYPQITSILTSGGLAKPIHENKMLINQLCQRAGHMNILLGGGITEHNLPQLVSETRAQHFHLGTAVQTDGTVSADKVSKIKALIARR